MALPAFIKEISIRQEDMLGNAMDGRAATKTLRVSPNGRGRDGLSWADAYQTIEDALDAASTNANEQTRILVAPGAYDINRAGNPTWSCNVEIRGTHRNWAIITNTHATATSIMRFTGRVSLVDLTFDCGTGSLNGVIMDNGTTDGCRVRQIYFECEAVTGAQTALELTGGVSYARLQDVEVHGVVGFTRGLLLDNVKLCHGLQVEFHDCLTGLQLLNAGTDQNEFHDLIFDDCALGIDIDAGNSQIFDHVIFHNCTRNIDDEVGDSHWSQIEGEIDVRLEPDNLVGITINCGAAGVYGGDTQIVAAAVIDNPFRIVGYALGPSANEWYTIRLSDDSGATFFDVDQFDANKKAGISAPSGTEHIFNAGTRISASARSVTGGNNTVVWLIIQEI